MLAERLGQQRIKSAGSTNSIQSNRSENF